MILDVNGFIGKWPYWPLAATEPADVAGQLHGWGIDRAAVCSTRALFVNWEDGNCETEQACRAHPDCFIPFACLGTRELSHMAPKGDYDFAGYQARGFRGVRLYPQHHSYHALWSPFIDRILEDAAARGWPVLLPLRTIMNWGMPSLDPAVMETLVLRHPRVQWILAGINYLFELQMAVSLMRRLETVHLETSCVMGFEAVRKLVEACGAEHLLFGSASPVQHGAANLEKVLRANIGDAAREAILSGNAARLLQLD